MLSPERIEGVIETTKAVLHIAKFAVPGGAIVVVVGSTVTDVPMMALPISVAALAALAFFGLGYLTARFSAETRKAIAVAALPAAERASADRGAER